MQSNTTNTSTPMPAYPAAIEPIDPRPLQVIVAGGPEEKARAEAKAIFAEGDRLARAGQWQAASRSYESGLDLDPSYHWHWYVSASLFLEMGDEKGYRRQCREMLGRFGQDADPAIADRTAKACLLVPDAVPDMKRVLELADRTVTGTEKHRYYPYFQISKALAEYRTGHFPAAIDWLRKSDPNFGQTRIYPGALSRLVRAMAYARMQPADLSKARTALAEAVQIMDTQFPQLSAGALDGNWNDWLHCRILRREAEALLKIATKESSTPAK